MALTSLSPKRLSGLPEKMEVKGAELSPKMAHCLYCIGSGDWIWYQTLQILGNDDISLSEYAAIAPLQSPRRRFIQYAA